MGGALDEGDAVYTIFATENSEYMESESWPVGEFEGWEEAVEGARQVVERSLQELYEVGIGDEVLYLRYISFGEDAYITPTTDGQEFSAWGYARERCREICDAQRGEADPSL